MLLQKKKTKNMYKVNNELKNLLTFNILVIIDDSIQICNNQCNIVFSISLYLYVDMYKNKRLDQ